MMDRGASSEEEANRRLEDGCVWLPDESDAKPTDKGWFWHSNQQDLSAERLFRMYLETVGRNSNLILNIPPDRSGSLPASSVNVLKSLGQMLTSRLGTDLVSYSLYRQGSSGNGRNSAGTTIYEYNNGFDNMNMPAFTVPSDLAPGIYIKRQGTKVTKILVR